MKNKTMISELSHLYSKQARAAIVGYLAKEPSRVLNPEHTIALDLEDLVNRLTDEIKKKKKLTLTNNTYIPIRKRSFPRLIIEIVYLTGSLPKDLQILIVVNSILSTVGLNPHRVELIKNDIDWIIRQVDEINKVLNVDEESPIPYTWVDSTLMVLKI